MYLNCDLGEGCGDDAHLMPLIDQASVACGGHAGDAESMRATVALAARHGARILGPASAIAALGTGQAIEALAIEILAGAAAGSAEGRGPRALYLADVDAAPQTHKSLARA